MEVEEEEEDEEEEAVEEEEEEEVVEEEVEQEPQGKVTPAEKTIERLKKRLRFASEEACRREGVIVKVEQVRARVPLEGAAAQDSTCLDHTLGPSRRGTFV